MAYTINLSNGAELVTIPDGTVNNTACSLTLLGKNYAGYGLFLNNDLVHLLENFANSDEPDVPLSGQLWWDTAGNLKVYNGTEFKTLGTTTSSLTAPTNGVTGNAWWDQTNNQLRIYNGNEWILIGPAFSIEGGTVNSEAITDTGDVIHDVLSVEIGTSTVAYISKDSEFTPQEAIAGFSTIKPGFNLSTAISDNKFVGSATDADKLGGVLAENFARRDIAVSFANTVSILNNNGLTVGNTFNAKVSGNLVQLKNNITSGNIAFIANVTGADFTAISINGQNGSTTIANLVLTGVVNTPAVTATSITTANLTATANIVSPAVITTNLTTGSTSTPGRVTGTWTLISGSSFGATYADLAEYYESDAQYLPGTVLEFGGEKEVTLAEEDSNRVAGVVSSNPAYLMNVECPGIAVPIALQGRVPVKAKGIVRKGDMLVSGGNGFAKSTSSPSMGSVIGKALENLDDNEGIIEIAIGRL